MWGIATQIGVATAILPFSEGLSWFGVGLCSLVFFSAGGLLLTALRGNNSEPLTYASEALKSEVYHQTA